MAMNEYVQVHSIKVLLIGMYYSLFCEAVEVVEALEVVEAVEVRDLINRLRK